MLADMTPQQFEELVEMEQLHPRDNGWQQAAIVATAIQNTLESLRLQVTAALGDKNPKPQYIDPSDLIPNAPKKPKKPQQTASQIIGALTSRYGKNNR